jgi:hypothetical protein
VSAVHFFLIKHKFFMRPLLTFKRHHVQLLLLSLLSNKTEALDVVEASLALIPIKNISVIELSSCAWL